jgi:hypothetical protein
MGILASVFVLVVLGLLMFADVASAGPRGLQLRWLPLLSGAPLKAWAALRSRFATSEWLGSHPERTESNDLARSIEADTSQLLDEAVFSESPAARGVQRCQQAIVPQVTPPEVFAIAAELRKLSSSRQKELQQHLSLAVQTGEGTCPLLTNQGTCLCPVARPVECRSRCLAGFDSCADAMEWAKDLEEGMIEGLQRELNEAGLDGGRYDLNQGLARVISDPAAESRWLRGERLLASDPNVTSTP